MAAPSGIKWGSIVGGYGRLGLYVSVSSTNTESTVSIQVWFGSKYSVGDTGNTLYFDNGKSSATTSKGSVSINTTVDSGSGWSGSNEVKLKTYTYTYSRGTSASKKSCAAKLTGIDVVGGTMTVSTSYTIPALASYKITFNANGGSGAPGQQTKYYGKTLTLSTTKPTRTGYTFQGWGTSASGSVVYASGGSYTANASDTLYAIWKANTYTVSYNANGGSGAPGNQTKTYGVALTLSSTKPTRTNYNFKGWGTSAGSTTVAYAAGASYTANAAITLYAIWELAYTKPRITNFVVQRCNSAGTATESGTYVKATFNWASDRTATAIYVQWRLATSTTWSSASITPSGTSGSVSKVVGSGAISTESSYVVRAYVSDSGGTTYTSETSVGTVKFPIDVKAGGTGVAFGKVAETAGIADFGFGIKCIDTKGLTRISRNGVSTPWNKGRDNAIFKMSSISYYSPFASIKTSAGSWDIGSYDNSSYLNQLVFTYITDTSYSGTNSVTAQVKFLADGGISAPGISSICKARFENYWIGFYGSQSNAQSGTSRLGWIGHDGSNLRIQPETGKICLCNDVYFGSSPEPTRYNLKLSSGSGNYADNVYILNEAKGYMAIGCGDNLMDTYGSRLYLEMKDRTTYDMFIRPRANNMTTLGTSAQRWYNIYTSRSVNVSSDRRIKEQFTEFDDRYVKLFESLKPTIYKLKSDSEEKSKLAGFIAQDVEDAMNSCEINKREFGICKHDEESDSYALIYDMFIPLTVNYVQTKQKEFVEYKEKTKEKIQTQQEEIDYLKKQVKELKELVLNLSKGGAA